jgi:hypothetical protein
MVKHRIPASVLFFLLLSLSKANPPKHGGSGNQLHFGPVIGFYTINPKHAKNPVAKMSAFAGFNREVRLDRSYRGFFSFGIDYFFHGVNFRSYYFKPDSVQLYDKSFGYNYSLLIHELNLPLQLKYLFKRADNSLFSPYVVMAYHLRYLLPAHLRVTQNGSEVTTDAPELKFKTPFLNEKINSFVSAGVGWQKNSISTSGGSFFVELNFRYGFSPYYFKTDYSPSSLYINSMHLSLELGFKF